MKYHLKKYTQEIESTKSNLKNFTPTQLQVGVGVDIVIQWRKKEEEEEGRNNPHQDSS